MNVKNSKNVSVFVASAGNPSGESQCPRAIISREGVKLRDDYKGKLFVSKKTTRAFIFA